MRPAILSARSWIVIVALAALLVLLALARPLDHDESQYVAAAVLAQGGLPYRDFAYCQTPLQPMLFAPLAWLFGGLVWPGLRIVNALLGAATVALVAAGARAAGGTPRTALAAAGLFAACDIFLFSTAVARNDMLPAALLALALWRIVVAARGDGGRVGAVVIGLALAGAAAAKISYAPPAVAFGVVALCDRRQRPGWIAAGAVLPVALVLYCALAAPPAFLFEMIGFPASAPAQYYIADGRGWKLAPSARALDLLKFLALGPALAALWVVARARQRDRLALTLDILIVAALVAAILPAPTWRQYLLPVLPPLFVRLVLAWRCRPPGLAQRLVLAVFAGAGVAPSLAALAPLARQRLPMAEAVAQSRAIRAAMDRAGVAGPVASLSPQFVAGAGRPIDRRFAAGPFYFRGHGLLDPPAEAAMHLIGMATLAERFRAAPPAAVLVGGEAPWTSGNAATDAMLEQVARGGGWRQVPVPGGRFRLYVRR